MLFKFSLNKLHDQNVHVNVTNLVFNGRKGKFKEFKLQIYKNKKIEILNN